MRARPSTAAGCGVYCDVDTVQEISALAAKKEVSVRTPTLITLTILMLLIIGALVVQLATAR